VDFAPSIFNRVVNHFMLEIVQTLVGISGIGENGGPG